MDIGVGDSVEICSNEDGLLGSYYVAKFNGKHKKKGEKYYLVEYQTLAEDEDEDEVKPLKEKAESYKVRPVPPIIRVPYFDIMDKVDAYDLDGWWVGRITGRFNNTYNVYFDSSGDELPYNFNKLRVHQEFGFLLGLRIHLYFNLIIRFENRVWIPSQLKDTSLF